jgi:hypothetical protein
VKGQTRAALWVRKSGDGPSSDKLAFVNDDGVKVAKRAD